MFEAIRLRSCFILGYHCFATETWSLTSLVSETEKGAIQDSISLHAIGSAFGFLLAYLLDRLDLFPFASQPSPFFCTFSRWLRTKLEITVGREHSVSCHVFLLLPHLSLAAQEIMNNGETGSAPSPYERCTELTGEVSVFFFLFHLPKVLQNLCLKSFSLLSLIMCNF